MPTVITSTSFTTKFSLNTTPAKFVLTDTTDISSPSIPSAGVREIFTIVDPDGNTIYNNTDYSAPDILRSSGTTNLITISLPLNADGTVVAGQYTITQNTQIIDGSNPTYYLTKSYTYTYDYIVPEVSITQIIDCLSPLFTSVDATNYTVNGTAPASMTRTHTVDYPYGSAGEGSPVTGSTATITTSTFYSGTQTTVISTIVTYIFGDGLIVTDTVAGSKEILVDCSFVCSINCCLRSLYNNVENNRGRNQVMFEDYSALFNEVMSIVTLCLVSIDCGKANDVAGYLNKIKTIANCQDDCACSDGTPQLITGLGNGSGVTVDVVSGATPVIVSSNTVGNVTTFTITLDSAFVDKVNAFTFSVVDAGTGISVAANTVGDTTTYTVTNTAPFVPLNTQQVNVQFQYSNFAAPTVSLNIYDYVGEGANMQSPTISNVNGSIGVGNWKNQNNLFSINAFQVTPNDTFKIFASIYNGETQDINGNLIDGDIQYLNAQPIDIRMLGVHSGYALFQFVYKDTGIPVSNTGMVFYDDTVVQFLIKE